MSRNQEQGRFSGKMCGKFGRSRYQRQGPLGASGTPDFRTRAMRKRWKMEELNSHQDRQGKWGGHIVPPGGWIRGK
jgi:hypothetical protein